MRAHYIGCTLYFHSSKRHNTIHFASTSSRNVSCFCGLHQPSLVRTGRPGATVGRATSTAAVGVPRMGFAATGTVLICPCNISSRAVDMTSKPATRPGLFVWTLIWQTRGMFWWVWKPRRQPRSRARRDCHPSRRERWSCQTRRRVRWSW
jgi:hypothetical protein